VRQIKAQKITNTVSRLCQEANFFLPEDVIKSLEKALETEESSLGKEVLSQMLKNADIAARENIPVCQDTGMAIVFVDIGQNVQIVDGDPVTAVNEGIRKGYREGYLRKSIVKDPLFTRQNTGDNTPGVIHVQIVSGDSLRVAVFIKGGGSEGVGKAEVLKPADGIDRLKNFVLKTVEEAGANPCPPTIIGVGCGGTLDYAALLAKKALLRRLGEFNNDTKIADLEKELLKRINDLGIGPAGLGGRVTSLAVHIETHPSHMATLPVAVDVGCYALRRKEATL
jgi:fumarate hydratase subunit alpha